MNCKLNDIAVIHSLHHSVNGMVVTCVKYFHKIEWLDDFHLWRVDKEIVRGINYVPDENLMPIGNLTVEISNENLCSI